MSRCCGWCRWRWPGTWTWRPDVTLLRVVPMAMAWYVDLIEDADAEVGDAAREAWAETQTALRELELRDTPEVKWERTALFAYSLARRLEGKRPVYVLHGPRALRLPEPPHFVGLSEDLVALRFSRPDLVRESSTADTLAELPGGVELMAFEWDRSEAGTGEMVSFRSEWRLRERVPTPLQFGVGLIPAGVSPEHFAQRLSRDGFFVQAFPLVGEQQPEASPEGTVYEQRGWFIIPTNTPPGLGRTVIGIGPLYREQYVGWTEVGTIQVHARPRPANPP